MIGTELDAKLKNLILSRGYINDSAMSLLVDTAKTNSCTLVDTLLKERAIDEAMLLQCIAEAQGRDCITSLNEVELDKPVVANFSVNELTENHFVPIVFGGLTAFLETAIDTSVLDSIILSKYHKRPVYILCPETVMASVLGDNFSTKVLQGISDSINQIEDENYDSFTVDDYSSSSIAKLFTHILDEAMHRHATDIHISPGDGYAHVRFRIDTILVNGPRIKNLQMTRLVGWLALVSKMQETSTLRFQRGSWNFPLHDKTVSLRISIVPTAIEVPDLDIRILNTVIPDYNNLGFTDYTRKRLDTLCEYSQGLILFTGPVNSGKSMTAASIVMKQAHAGKYMCSIEDPVEVTLPGVTQIAVNPSADVTYITGVSSLLQHDIDGLYIGELRDHGAAAAAFEAGGTGHFILSTTHCPRAIAAIPRMRDLGISNYAMMGTLIASIGQRLFPKVCDHCSQWVEMPFDSPYRKMFGLSDTEEFKYRVPKGCDLCNRTGYRGLVPINEIVFIDDSIRDAIEQNYSLSKLSTVAAKTGYRDLFEDAMEKFRAGLVSLQYMVALSRARGFTDVITE
jgi:type IV pilus assembly protein PilB